MTTVRKTLAAASNSVRAVFAGDEIGPENTIDYVTIATLGNAIDFGDLIAGRGEFCGGASSTRAVFYGGNTAPTRVNTIDYVEIMSTGDALDFGDATSARSGIMGSSNGHGGL